MSLVAKWVDNSLNNSEENQISTGAICKTGLNPNGSHYLAELFIGARVRSKSPFIFLLHAWSLTEVKAVDYIPSEGTSHRWELPIAMASENLRSTKSFSLNKSDAMSRIMADYQLLPYARLCMNFMSLRPLCLVSRLHTFHHLPRRHR